MPAETPSHRIPYPLPDDALVDYPAVGQDLAETIEAQFTGTYPYALKWAMAHVLQDGSFAYYAFSPGMSLACARIGAGIYSIVMNPAIAYPFFSVTPTPGALTVMAMTDPPTGSQIVVRIYNVLSGAWTDSPFSFMLFTPGGLTLLRDARAGDDDEATPLPDIPANAGGEPAPIVEPKSA